MEGSESKVKSSKAEIEMGDYHFAVQQNPMGALSILLEPLSEDVPILEDGSIILNLCLDTTLAQASVIARMLNDSIETVLYIPSLAGMSCHE
jgi:uncharacterized Rmd1/YagE family protein